MGGKRGNTSVNKRKSGHGQTRLDDLFKPRRSTRLSSAEKSTIKKVKDDGTDCQILTLSDTESEVKVQKNVTLITSKACKKGGLSKAGKINRAGKASKDKEDERSQEADQALLKEFDLNCLYGPCRGITRRERYERAIKYNCRPTPDPMIMKVLDEHEDEFIYQKCIWDQNELLKVLMYVR